MPTTANITPAQKTDGVVYASAVPLVSTEAALGTQPASGDSSQTISNIGVVEGQTIVAIVKFSFSGIAAANNTYVFLQTDLGDGTWVDVAWCRFTGNQGTATFVLCAGGLGAMNNAFQQSRQASSAPATQANGSNAVPLGGRCRFTGFSVISGGSSAVPGLASQVTATITYKLQRPR